MGMFVAGPESLEGKPVEITGKWQVWMVDADGMRIGDPVTNPNRFASAMAFCRGYFMNSHSEDLTDGLVPVPFLVDQPTEPRPAKPLPATVAVAAPRFESMVCPDLTFTHPDHHPFSGSVDALRRKVDVINQELSQEADLSAANDF